MEEIWHCVSKFPGINTGNCKGPVMEFLECGEPERGYAYRRWLRQVKYALPAGAPWIPVEFRKPAVALEGRDQRDKTPASKSGEFLGATASELRIVDGASSATSQSLVASLLPFQRELSNILAHAEKHLGLAKECPGPAFNSQNFKPLPVSRQAQAKNSDAH